MAALPATTRYFNAGTSKYYFLPAIADTAGLVPTRAEITAGTDITNEVADVNGWLVQSGKIVTPDMGSVQDGDIPGKQKFDDSSITFYASIDGDDVRAVLPRDTNGYIVIADGGDVTGYLADVFKIRVGSVGKIRSTGEESFRLTITFAISKVAEDITLPATA